MISITEVKRKDLNSRAVDRICSILIPAFEKANVGKECNSFEFKHFWLSLLNGTPPAVLFLLRDEGVIVGILGGLVFDDPLTGLRYAAKIVWRVAPSHGGLGWGMKLLQSFEWWAKDHDCDRVVVSGSSNEWIDLQDKVKPLGYVPYQVEFMKEI